MNCPYQEICGGCPYRHLGKEAYRKKKLEQFSNLISAINQPDISQGEAIFIEDGTRRRAELTFTYRKGKLTLGFNQNKSNEIINIDNCLLLTDKLNSLIPNLRKFLIELCQIKVSEKNKGKNKGKKIQTYNIQNGNIHLTDVLNGVDILLEIEQTINLECRMLICDFANTNNDISRISIKNSHISAETIIEKSQPYIEICGRRVYIPAGTFLQASDAGEKALIQLVMQSIENSEGYIADLFCGVGTFSYPLSANPHNKITSIDSSEDLLNGFQKSINKNMISNINIQRKNLFKYPLDAKELQNFDIIVFDPPRAGASAQIQQIILMEDTKKPQKIIAVSCNPHTFANDANGLISAGYKIKNITLVDQFVYSPHSELVALFEKDK